MRVKGNNEKNTVDFEDLSAGDCFRYEKNLYVKSSYSQDAIGLSDGHALCNMCDTQVTPVNAEVQVID